VQAAPDAAKCSINMASRLALLCRHSSFLLSHLLEQSSASHSINAQISQVHRYAQGMHAHDARTHACTSLSSCATGTNTCPNKLWHICSCHQKCG